MKYTLLFTAVLLTIGVNAQKKITAKTIQYFDEITGPTDFDSTAYSYATYLGSVYSNGPTFGIHGGDSPYLWGFDSPDPDFSTSNIYFNSVLSTTFVKAYNASNQCISNTSNSGFRTLYTYNANGKLIQSLEQFNVGGNWTDSYKTVYDYDVNGRSISTIYYNFPSGIETLNGKDTLIYDGTTNNVIKSVYFNSPDGIALDSSTMFIHTFTGNNPTTLKFYQDDDSDPLTPMAYFIYGEYNYTGSNLMNLSGYPIVAGVPAPTPGIIIDYTYDANNKLSSMYQSGIFGLQGEGYEYDADGYLTNFYRYDETSAQDTVYLSKVEKYYYQSTAGIEGNTEIECDVYPNPSTGLFHVSAETAVQTISVFSNEGKVMVRQNGGSDIELTHLPAGSYVMEIVTESGVARKHVQKQ